MRSQLEWKAYQFRFLRIGPVLEVYTQVELFHEIENQRERVFSCAVCSNEGDYVPMGQEVVCSSFLPKSLGGGCQSCPDG